MQFAQGMGCNRNGKQEEVNVVFNMNDKKTRKIFSTIVIVLVVLAMVVPMILGSLLSIFLIVTAEAPKSIRHQEDISEEKRMKKNVWIAGMTAILSAGLVWLAPVFTLADERIPDGVSVGAVSLSGLTEEEAEKQIESYVNEKLNQDITLVVNGTEAKSDAQTLGVAWDNQDEVAEAIQGTELKGNLVKRYMKKKDLEVNPVKIELDLSVDQDKVSSFVSEKCGSAVAGAVDATIIRKDGKFEITPSKEGLTGRYVAIKAALNEALNAKIRMAIRWMRRDR